MFSCLCMATASFNGTTQGHVLLIFLRTILVVHVPVVCPHKPQGSASPRILGSVTTSPFCRALPHDCASLPKQWPLHKTNKVLFLPWAAPKYVPHQCMALHAIEDNWAPWRLLPLRCGECRRGCLLHFIRGTAPATNYLKKPHAYEQKKGQYNQRKEQNQKWSPTKRNKMRVPNPNSRGHATKRGL